MLQSLRRLVGRLIGVAIVVVAPLYAIGLFLVGWLVDVGPNRSPAAGLDELPAELWPVIVLLPSLWIVFGVRFVWRHV